MKQYVISGYDKDNDIFENYEYFDTYEQAQEKFGELKDDFRDNKLKSELGEPIDFIAIYDTLTNERLDIEIGE